VTAFDSFDRFTGLLSHVSYKPGWTLVAEHHDDGQLAIYRLVPDAANVHAEVTIMGGVLSHHEIDMTGSDAEILRAVYNALLECETHESLEWFRVDGDAVFDPHKESDALTPEEQAAMEVAHE
jgi:hypothetical protein